MSRHQPFPPQVFFESFKASSPRQKIHYAVYLTVQYFNDSIQNPGYIMEYYPHPDNMYTFILIDTASKEKLYFTHKIRTTAKLCVHIDKLFKDKLKELQQRINDATLTE